MIAIETDGVGSRRGTPVSLAVGARVATGRANPHSRVVAISLLLSTRPVAAWSPSMIMSLATMTLCASGAAPSPATVHFMCA